MASPFALVAAATLLGAAAAADCYCTPHLGNKSATLPNALIIGDSISGNGTGYMDYLPEVLGGLANALQTGSVTDNGRRLADDLGNHTPKGPCGTSFGVLECVDDWVGDGGWDYVANMKQIIAKLKTGLAPGGTIVWVSTTPVPASYKDRNDTDVVDINGIMADLIAFDDCCDDVVFGADLYHAVVDRCNRNATSSRRAAVARPVATAPVATAFSVVAASTLVACRDFPDACALVFASAKHAGGGFLKGAEAQEECVARGSALHAALTASQCRAFYIRHKTKGLYTDAIIYAPDVPLFRDERDELLEEPFPRCSFAVAAAPNAGVARRDGVADAEIKEVLRARISRVLTVARVRGHRDVILGAFGCGVFRNDPDVVAAAFADALAAEHRGAFHNVIFAIKGGPPANLAAFETRFRTCRFTRLALSRVVGRRPAE
ncbi:DUF2263-containing protein [Aureococcus anophagefferens]|nr:DUF2263-containing protein [Aureococcus anophagefferens]